MVNTTLGGMARGEIEHRLAIMIVDNTERGLGRVLREVAALVVDPLGGFNRLVRGEWSRQFQNPPDRIPGRFYIELDGLYQHRSGSAVAGDDTSQGGGAALVRYGDLFDGAHRAPFDYFDASGEIVQPAASLFTQFATRGLLADWVLSDDAGARQRLGLFLHFDYFNDAPLYYGAQAFALDHLMRVPLGKNFELTTEVGPSVMPLAAVEADYSTEENDGEINRGYDFGPGGGVHAFAYVRRFGVDVVKLGFSTQWQHTSNGCLGQLPDRIGPGAGTRPAVEPCRPRRGVDLDLAALHVLGPSDRLRFGHDVAGLRSGDVPVRRETMPMRSHVPRLAWLAALVVLVESALGPATAAAQESARWEISAFAGGFLGSRTYTSEKVNVLMASVPTYGLRLGYRLSPAFSIEAAWSRADSKLEPFDPATEEFFGTVDAGPREHLRSRRPLLVRPRKGPRLSGTRRRRHAPQPVRRDARPGLLRPVRRELRPRRDLFAGTPLRASGRRPLPVAGRADPRRRHRLLSRRQVRALHDEHLLLRRNHRRRNVPFLTDGGT